MTSLLGIRVALDAEIRAASQLSRRIGSGKKDKRYFVFEGTQFKYAAIPQTPLWFASIIRLRPQIVDLANPDSAQTVQVRDEHNYNTRASNIYRTAQH